MNFNELAEKLGLEEYEFMEMVELFIEVSESDLCKLESAIDMKNVQHVAESSHSIKGASGNLGFMEIFEMAKGLEMKARDNSLDGAREAAMIIKEKLEQLSRCARLHGP